MRLRPLHDRVVVKRLEEETKTAGGIIIPDTAAEKPQRGEVIAAGPGARGDDNEIVPMDVKVGGVDLLIMKESDIMGVLE
jgi:chaperonin GroES